jgi:GNAT superfamily N-acetyltransferase
VSDPDEFTISSDPAVVDVDAVHAYLCTSYWAEDIPRDIVARAIANSIPFSVWHRTRQVGFARVVTDRATFAYLSDVYVLEAYRGRGLARRLMDAVMAHPDLQGLRRFSLTTRDAEGLYRRYGFSPLATPARHLEIVRPGLYRHDTTSRTGT